MIFRKKPVLVEAFLWDGSNIDQIKAFVGGDVRQCKVTNRKLYIDTLEGVVTADIGDMIIKGVKGEYYPCKPDVFKETYERESL